MTDSVFAFDNIRVKAISLGLWDYIEGVEKQDDDRLYFKAEKALRFRLEADKNFQRTPVSKEHREWIRNVWNVPQGTGFVSYREARRPSLQITFFESALHCLGEMDIDLSSPLMDIWGFIVHTVEVLIPGPTNHRKLRAKLMKDPELRKHFA